MRDFLRGGLFALGMAVAAAGPSLAEESLWLDLPWHERVGPGWYERLAERGDAEAQYRLGQLYEEGIGVGADPELAEHWYAAAARQGHLQAQWRLAQQLKTEDPTAAAHWYRSAAERGHAPAAFNLAVMLENAQGLDLDLEAAAALYEQAYAGGVVEAALNRGLLELKQPAKDEVTALAWLLRARAAGVSGSGAAVVAVGEGMAASERSRAESLAAQ
ncbi:tetratricopeptide repeat protein [Aquibaculum arenosum]|uniref:Tetratricopeptide repeat protein n=1 Tax=Aquibaculum arenosum TaxID=3032591 RepID=A0ABT5YJW6_9PROT|nr:tetratricopeptide repeat protein [Fodinicurvata sp. CAU 1616]MDF2095148.1 tetratricopeptide repeat protein [Fodinicurvata sp. CAU 1616]